MTGQTELLPAPTSEDVAVACHSRVHSLQETAVAIENNKLRALLRDLLATIELHTDCMSNMINREALDPYIEQAERYGIDA